MLIYCYGSRAVETLYAMLVLAPLCVSIIHSSTVELHIGAFFDMNTTDGGWNSAGVLPAVQMAADHVNQRTDLLPGYTLKLHRKDTRCSDAYAIKVLIEQLSDPHTMVALLGPGCSIAAEPVASVAHFWNLIQIAYSVGSPRLSDRSRYPNFFRLNSAETNFNRAILALLKRFKWSKVAVVKQDEGIFNDVNEDLQALLKEEGITLLAANSFVDNPDSVINDLKEKDARIIIPLMYADKCRKLMCSAYKNRFFGAHLVWLMRGWYTPNWWEVNSPDVSCTANQIRLAAGDYLATEEVISSTLSSPTVAGLTPPELRQLYVTERKKYSYPVNSYAPYGYDTIWVLALALNFSLPLLAKKNLSLSNFSYKNKEMSDVLNQFVSNTSFFGMSGYVQFDGNGDNKNDIWIEQMQGEEEVKVGIYSAVDGITMLSNKSVKWPGGIQPSDHQIKSSQLQRVDKTLFITMVVLSCIGIIVALCFLVFNINNRKNIYIRMSSPKMNNLIAVGCIMCYACVFLFGADTLLESSQVSIHSALCKVRLWMMSVGFTVAYGAMFVKTWRVYRIFTNTEMNKELGGLHDRHLAGMLLVLVCGEVVYLAIWQAMFPLTTTLTELPGRNSGNEIVIPVMWTCDCEYFGTWIACLYGYKGLLLVMGLFLAWETRNVTFPALNDSKHIGISVYNVVLSASIAVPLEFALTQQNVNASFALDASVINICTSFTLAMLFFPKIRALKIHPTVQLKTVAGPASTTSLGPPRPHPNCPGCKCE